MYLQEEHLFYNILLCSFLALFHSIQYFTSFQILVQSDLVHFKLTSHAKNFQHIGKKITLTTKVTL